MSIKWHGEREREVVVVGCGKGGEFQREQVKKKLKA